MNSQSTQGLIGFLAKKSLFKTENKSKQISFNDANSFKNPSSQPITPKAKNQSMSQISQFNVFRDTSQKQLQKKGISQLQKPSSIHSTNIVIKPSQQHRFDKIKPNDIYFSHIKENTKQQNPQSSNLFKSSNNNNKNLLIGFNPSPQKIQSKTFDSLQLEAERCLQSISYRLNQEIHKLSESIEIFNAKMLKILNAELQSVKIKIFSMVNEVFQQSEKTIITYIKQQQIQIVKDVLQIKEQLEKQYTKITEMCLKIKTSEWRKTAAEMIGTDIENHVDTLIDKAKLIKLRPLQINHQQKFDQLNQFNKVIKEITNVKNYLK